MNNTRKKGKKEKKKGVHMWFLFFRPRDQYVHGPVQFLLLLVSIMVLISLGQEHCMERSQFIVI